MTLASRVTDLAVAIRTKINAMMPRLLPSGGTMGQVLAKTTANNYETGWSTLPAYAPLNSPALTGNPTAPTQALSDYDTSIATTQFVSDFLYTGAWADISLLADTRIDANRPKGLSASCAGKPAASDMVGSGIAPYALTLSAANSSAIALVAATASTVLVIKRAGTQIGTITFGAGATAGVVAYSSTAVTAGQNLTIHAPATPDATLADLSFLLRA